jgi:hypothetical protein
MQKKRDISTSLLQLELRLDSTDSSPKAASNIPSNVLHVQFGASEASRLEFASKDQIFIDRILESAQRLKW